VSKVAVIGSGFVGRAWAISFARGGHEVALWDQDPRAPETGLAYIGKLLPDLEDNDLLDGASAQAIAKRMRAAATMEAALDGAGHIQENTPEDIAVKREIFARLDALAAPEAVLASSTSAILPSAFTENLRGRARCLVVHPINPPYLIPAVEVVPAPWTDVGVVERTAALLRAAGHAPIVMKREIDGFVMNRLQGALLEEAFRLVADGCASIEDVDIGIRDGLALRWSFMGPFETIDLNAPGGIADYLRRYGPLYQAIEHEHAPLDWSDDALIGKVEAERRERLPARRLGERSVWRDRRLMTLAAYKREAAKEIGE
jgi:L-gulonate 3-dehydrogenase